MNILIVGNDLRTKILTKSLLDAKHHVTCVSKSRSFCAAIANQTDQIHWPQLAQIIVIS
jgi:hypothetical protein